LTLKTLKANQILGKKVVFLIVGVLLIDQIVKVLVKTQLAPHEQVGVIDGFFQLYYIENRGMAFGTTLGAGLWAKYALSLFRLIAIVGIGYYIRKLLKEPNYSKGMVLSVGLIFAGATGNLIDGMFYDYIWELDPEIAWNWDIDSNNSWVIGANGMPELRPHGFLLGSVVDMFQFTLTWPSWMPFDLAGKEIFAAIWNVADGAITLGVGIIIFRYRSFFKKPEPVKLEAAESDVNLPIKEVDSSLNPTDSTSAQEEE
jgi:signal peptidase II